MSMYTYIACQTERQPPKSSFAQGCRVSLLVPRATETHSHSHSGRTATDTATDRLFTNNSNKTDSLPLAQ